jgi:hypothetical protein
MREGRSAESAGQIRDAVAELERFLLARFLESEAVVGGQAGRRRPARQEGAAQPALSKKRPTRTGKPDDA